MRECLIVAGGTVDMPLLNSIYNDMDKPVVIGADRGVLTLMEANIPVDIAVGDFDSVTTEERLKIVSKYIVELNPVKDDLDTEHALNQALDMGMKSIIILGGTGSRLDQTLAVIMMLRLALDRGASAFVIDKSNRIRIVKDSCILHREEIFGDYISILPYGNDVKVSLSGFEYDGENILLEAASGRGISNSLKEDIGHIECDDYIILIESRSES